LKQFKASGGT